MKRTTYMQSLLTTTYPGIAVEAIKNGFDGAWERLIANRLKQDALRDVSEAQMILESVGYNHMKAAYLITSSTIQTHEQTT